MSNPLQEPMLAYCWLKPFEKHVNESCVKIQNYSLKMYLNIACKMVAMLFRLRCVKCDTNAWGQLDNGLGSGPSHSFNGGMLTGIGSSFNTRRAARFHISSLICRHLVTKGFREIIERRWTLEENIYDPVIIVLHVNGLVLLGAVIIKSLAPLEILMSFWKCYFQSCFTDWYLQIFLW